MASKDRLENGRNEDAPYRRDKWSWEEPDVHEPPAKWLDVVLHSPDRPPTHAPRRPRYWEL